MSFLQPGYEIPKKPSKYMKFQKGGNRFRILSDAITGWEYWNKENKPQRSPEPYETTPQDIKTEAGLPTDIKHFWAFVIWNYAESNIQILQLTQTSIMDEIKAGIELRNGKATGNDIGVQAKGDGFERKYTVQFADPSPVPAEAEVAFKAQKIDLTALYRGEDPFGSETPTERKVEEAPAVTEDIDVADIPF